MGVRSVRTWMLVLLSMIAGFAPGVLVGREWARELEHRWRRSSERLTRLIREHGDPEQARQDSLAFERLSRVDRQPPREIRRLQVFRNCVITLEVRDSTWANLQLINVRGHYNGPAVLREGWHYREEGYRQGDLVSVVLPETECGSVHGISCGASLVLTPEERARMGPSRPPRIPVEPVRPDSA